KGLIYFSPRFRHYDTLYLFVGFIPVHCAHARVLLTSITLIITVELECCHCSAKIQKVLCCIQDHGEFVIEKIVYEKDKVLVSGPFDADKLSSKLCCKAGRIIKKIEVAKPPSKTPDPPKSPKKEPVMCPYPDPYPYPQPAWPCSCPTPYCCWCPSSKPPPPPPKKEPKPPETKPKPDLVIYPYPYSYTCPQPAWPCSCPTPHCGCKPKPAPSPPPPEPPKPPACQCPAWSPCYCSGGYPPYMPSPMPYPMVVCDDSPPYGACTVM
ncbi:protein PYRICULARIA ORYZAE RESISTANCE 21-like, partial [Panicum virgatum]|uniref:protein PYRICULARIA ORYZAE RESISTANCE 21-like n=1 Tax=Panicum virgatum TaxID=38727 RepID=UPI0019D555D6